MVDKLEESKSAVISAETVLRALQSEIESITADYRALGGLGGFTGQAQQLTYILQDYLDKSGALLDDCIKESMGKAKAE